VDLAGARALVERQAQAWEQGDLHAISADFAPDGVFISPGGRWQGPAGVREAAASFFALFRDVQVEITRVLLDDDQGAVEWTWHETRRADGRRTATEDGIIFVVRDDKIIYWREYFDTAPTLT
jgi:uncharacterized protein (TIGR02246 family)